MAHELHLFHVEEGESLEGAAERVLRPLGPHEAPTPLSPFEERRRAYLVTYIRTAAPTLAETDVEAAIRATGLTDERALWQFRRVEFLDKRADGTGVLITVHARHITIHIPDRPQCDGDAPATIKLVRRVCATLTGRGQMRIVDLKAGREATIANEPDRLIAEPGDCGGTVETECAGPVDVEVADSKEAQGVSRRGYGGELGRPVEPPSSTIAAQAPSHERSTAFIPRGKSQRQRLHEKHPASRTRFLIAPEFLMLGGIVGLGLVFVGQIFERPRTWGRAGVVLLGVDLALFTLLVFTSPSRNRRWRAWRRAGCCLECGYSRKGLPESADCPECGAPSAYV